MTKEFVFTKEDGSRIRGKMYLPESAETGGKKLPAVIFSHGFGSNYRELMHHGDGFAREGICCFFFDFCGGGRLSLSDGSMESMTVSSECGDLKCVIENIKKLNFVDPEQIFLQGESMGGLVSALTAARHPEEIRALVLWYPAFVIPEDSQKRYAAGEKEVFGITLSGEFDREAMNIDVYGEIPRYAKPVLLIHGEKDPVVPIGYSERAVKVYPDAELIVIPGAGHGYDGADSAAAREYSIAFLKKHGKE